MRWRRGQGSGQIEDRRGMGPMTLGAGGLGGVGLVLYLIIQLMGGGGFAIDPGLDALPGAQGDRRMSGPDPDAGLVDFMGFVMQDVQASWEQILRDSGQSYEPTSLVLFEQGTQTGCGIGSAASGPFYCPADRKVYLDLGFFQELQRRFDAPGDFAQAYVIAHEVGHHVQNLLGIESQVRNEQRSNPHDANELSIRMELQADCFAGVWAYTAYDEGLLENGDLEEGLNAAAAVGDDRIQEQAGEVHRESWTHGSSGQRMKWFRRGFDTGKPEACDTFSSGV